MATNNQSQLSVLLRLLLVYALLAPVAHAFVPLEQLHLRNQALPCAVAATPRRPIGLAERGGVLVPYGVLGISGLGLPRRLGRPAVFREVVVCRNGLLWHAILGVALGGLIVLMDRVWSPPDPL